LNPKKVSSALSAEIRRADWTLHYPEKCDAETVLAVLKPVTRVENGWEAFPWHLTGRLESVLENPESNFEYLYLTTYFLSRAAQVALSGHIVDHQDLHQILSKYRVQVGGMYREHMLFHVHRHLVKHNLTKLPTCQTDELDPAHDAEQEARDRREVQKLALLWEYELGRTLTHLSVATSMEEVVTHHPVKFWASGGGMVNGLDVLARVRWQEDGTCIIRPSKDDVKRFTKERLPLKTIVVRSADSGEGRSQKSGVRSQNGEEDRRTECASHIGEKASGGGRETADRGPRTEGIAGTVTTPRLRGLGKTAAHVGKGGTGKDWKVVGDFHLIIPPNGQEHINLATKHKARALLRFIYEQLTARGAAEFYVEEMRQDFNAQFSRDMAHRRWVSDRFREDLFRGKEREFDLIYERLDKAAGRYRMRAMGWLWSQCGLVALGLWGIGEWVQCGVGELMTGLIGDGWLLAAGMAC
jgi:hypothetical protein